jgi:glycosyltransferase involved in cell wall biosynthesis
MWNDAIRLVRLPRPPSPLGTVLFITNMWPDERRPYYGSFIASQAHSLRDAGVGVDVLYVRGYLGPHIYAKALAAVPRAARRRRYDLIHVHYGHTAAVSLGVLQRPLIISFCGMDVTGAQREGGITPRSRVELTLFRQLGRFSDATITKSLEMELALPRSLRARNHILPNGVDLQQFAPRPRSESRAVLGWDPDEKVILFLGNPRDPRKHVELAQQAAALVARRRRRTRLHIAWAIAPTDVPTYMNAADCLVFPSRGEGSPNAIKEAMACELPIVATAVGDIRERFEGVEGCVICEPTPAAFADGLMAALDIDRVPGARDAVRELGIERIADRLLAIYGEAGAQLGRWPATELAAA